MWQSNNLKRARFVKNHSFPIITIIFISVFFSYKVFIKINGKHMKINTRHSAWDLDDVHSFTQSKLFIGISILPTKLFYVNIQITIVLLSLLLALSYTAE